MPTSSSQTTTCVIHCRVSSTKQSQEGESLDVQESICRNIALDRGWTLAREPWKESYSGRKTHRPVFESILEFIDQHPGVVNYYLFRSIDRATRGGSLAYGQIKQALAKRGVEMVDSYGIIQSPKNTLEDVGFEYEWSKSSPSEIAEVVVATSAKHEVTQILTRLIGQEIRLRQRGFKIRRAVDGYVNKRTYVDGKKRTIEIPDPQRAQYFKLMFDMRALGQYTDKEICERVNAMGYRTRAFNRWDAGHQKIIGHGGGGLLTPRHLQELIQRPIYCGVICEKWTRHQPIKAQYDGLVSMGLFNAANNGKVYIREKQDCSLEILYDYRPEKLAAKLTRNNLTFPFKNVVLCPLCRKPLLGSSPRGRSGKHFPTYHCARNHKYFGVRKVTLDTAVERFVNSLRFEPKVFDGIREALLDRYLDRQSEVLRAAAVVGHGVAELEVMQAKTIEAFKVATTQFMRRALEEDAKKLDKQIQEARMVRETIEITEQDIHWFIKEVKWLMEHPAELLKDPANPHQQRALYSLFFDELPTYKEIIDGTAKLAWIFCLSSSAATPESALVRLRGFGWNTIEHTIHHWKENVPLALTLGMDCIAA